MIHRDTPRLNVLVQHADPLITVGLVAALRLHPDIEVVTDGTSADVIVTDYQAGLDAAPTARRAQGAKVMVVTAQDREQDVRIALERGVHGYLLLGCPIDELATGVRVLSQGNRYLCMAVSQRMADSLTREALTAREADVLRLLATGDCNKAIAKRLDIALGTVKAHVKSIMNKLDAASRTHAVTIASRRGLVDELRAPPVAPARHLAAPARQAYAQYA